MLVLIHKCERTRLKRSQLSPVESYYRGVGWFGLGLGHHLRLVQNSKLQMLPNFVDSVIDCEIYEFYIPSQVMEGLLQAHPSVISLREHCAQLLGHEATRVFHDRLVDEADREFFYKVLSDELHNGFRVRWSPEQLQNEPFVFGDFLDASSPHSTRAYRFVRSYDRLPKVLEVCYVN